MGIPAGWSALIAGEARLRHRPGWFFFAEDSGRFVAVDAAQGKQLWSFDANQLWKASPMAYQFDGQEYVAIASGQTITAFTLPKDLH